MLYLFKIVAVVTFLFSGERAPVDVTFTSNRGYLDEASCTAASETSEWKVAIHNAIEDTLDDLEDDGAVDATVAVSCKQLPASE